MTCEQDLVRFQELLVQTTGIAVPDEELCNLSSLLEELAGQQTRGDIHAYLLLLASRSSSHPDWERIALAVTIGESYFLRDRGQIQLLEKMVLPGLIEANRDTRCLRIISAGCSSGEEPYSIAMLLHDLLPDWSTWNIDVVGLDLNPEAITKARAGMYRQWSFRGHGKSVQSKYFSEEKGCWKINSTIKQSVRFLQHNLLKDALPDTSKQLVDVDLIICRNVFIYFSFEAIATVLERFINTLSPGGYLLTGHVELTKQDLTALEIIQTPESLVYRKRAVPAQPSSLPLEHATVTAPITQIAEIGKPEELQFLARKNESEELGVDTFTSEEFATESSAENLFQSGEYERVIQLLSCSEAELTKDSMKLLIEACVNTGKVDEARKQCTRFIERDDLNPFPYYLLAHLAQESGEISEAKKLLRKVIYLDPRAIGAYLSLGNLYDAEGNYERAERERRVALKELQNFRGEDPVPYLDEVRVAQVISHIESLVEEER